MATVDELERRLALLEDELAELKEAVTLLLQRQSAEKLPSEEPDG
jgi:uncharacterized small protein (DUF1192 family)